MSSGAVTTGSLTAGELAERVEGELIGPAGIEINGVEAMHVAGPGHLSFIASSSYAAEWSTVKAGAALVSRGIEVPGHDPSTRALIVVDDAELALIKILTFFATEPDLPPVGVHSSAVVDESARLGSEVRIGPFVTIGAHAVIGDGVSLGSGVRVGQSAMIGDHSMISEHVIIGARCRVGSRCRIYPHASIGGDGFGFRPAMDGSGLSKIPHIGTVELGNDVELGANTCVDRGKFGATVIGEGTKIDNLVQVAHNVHIGSHCVIASQAGIAGSAVLGNWVQIGAQAGVADQVKVGDGARVGAKTGLMRDVEAGGTVLGTPADDARKFLRQVSSLRKLPEFMAKQRSSDR